MTIEVPDHLKDRFEMLMALPFGSPPTPWRKVSDRSVGGLTEVGFADSSDLLLIASSAGLGIVDCTSGELVARSHSDDFEFDAGNLTIQGIGPLSHLQIRVAGLHGGGLTLGTEDGWSVERNPTSWPAAEIFLFQNFHSIFWSPNGQAIQATRMGNFVTDLRAYGFSPTGRSFVIATSSDLTVFTRWTE